MKDKRKPPRIPAIKKPADRSSAIQDYNRKKKPKVEIMPGPYPQLGGVPC